MTRLPNCHAWVHVGTLSVLVSHSTACPSLRLLVAFAWHLLLYKDFYTFRLSLFPYSFFIRYIFAILPCFLLLCVAYLGTNFRMPTHLPMGVDGYALDHSAKEHLFIT